MRKLQPYDEENQISRGGEILGRIIALPPTTRHTNNAVVLGTTQLPYYKDYDRKLFYFFSEDPHVNHLYVCKRKELDREGKETLEDVMMSPYNSAEPAEATRLLGEKAIKGKMDPIVYFKVSDLPDGALELLRLTLCKVCENPTPKVDRR